MDWKNTVKDIGLSIGKGICDGYDQASKKMAKERDDYKYCPAGKNLSDMIDDYRKKN